MSILQAAVDVGELSTAAQPKALARTIEAILSGSMMTWAFYREGSAGAWIRKDLDAVLAPYVNKRRK